jgi:hypothetical protein
MGERGSDRIRVAQDGNLRLRTVHTKLRRWKLRLAGVY